VELPIFSSYALREDFSRRVSFQLSMVNSLNLFEIALYYGIRITHCCGQYMKMLQHLLSNPLAPAVNISCVNTLWARALPNSCLEPVERKMLTSQQTHPVATHPFQGRRSRRPGANWNGRIRGVNLKRRISHIVRLHEV